VHAPIARFLPRPGVDPVLLGAVGAAWLLMLALVALDATAVIEHDAILAGGAAWPVAVAVFIGSWQLMTAVMMLPTSLPMVRAFATTAARQPRPLAAMAAFLGGYFAIWTAFALAALAGDAGLHWLVDRWSWLADRPWLISGGVLVGAGAFQFSSIKERCLAECRSPVQFLWRHYQRGVSGAWQLGLRHGVFCLGCCWALMLIMFAVGVGSLAWMAGLTGVMLLEKTSRLGRRLVPIVGVALIVWGGLILLPPGAATAHAGEVHAPPISADPLIGIGVIGMALALVAIQRRKRRLMSHASAEPTTFASSEENHD
jgi:predicted metal-binding membrane protein